MSTADGVLRRLERVEERLRVHATHEFPAGALTAPDPPTGERWQAGQVWAHVAEFIPYWHAEAAALVARGAGEPAPFGRTKSDPGRIAAIERDRRTDPAALWTRAEDAIEGLRGFLAGLDDDAWHVRGRHPTIDVMDMGAIVEEFLVGHLEQHSDQLDALARA